MDGKHQGYDPYDSYSSRRWLGEYVWSLGGSLVGRFEYTDDHHFYDPSRPKYHNHIDYERPISTRPRDPADWTALRETEDMNDPLSGFGLWS